MLAIFVFEEVFPAPCHDYNFYTTIKRARVLNEISLDPLAVNKRKLEHYYRTRSSDL